MANHKPGSVSFVENQRSYLSFILFQTHAWNPSTYPPRSDEQPFMHCCNPRFIWSFSS